MCTFQSNMTFYKFICERQIIISEFLLEEQSHFSHDPSSFVPSSLAPTKLEILTLTQQDI
jgi:hypothetical protein